MVRLSVYPLEVMAPLLRQWPANGHYRPYNAYGVLRASKPMYNAVRYAVLSMQYGLLFPSMWTGMDWEHRRDIWDGPHGLSSYGWDGESWSLYG